MTDSNTSHIQNAQQAENASAANNKHRIAASIVSFVAGLAVAGIVAGGLSIANPRGTATGGNTSASAANQQVSDSCSTTFDVVASVNQWGSLAQELGGSCVKVTSLINSTSVEPHDYEPTTSDMAKLTKADIVVLNGAGYDGWAEKAQFDKSKQTIVNVGDIMGITTTAAPTRTCGSARRPC